MVSGIAGGVYGVAVEIYVLNAAVCCRNVYSGLDIPVLVEYESGVTVLGEPGHNYVGVCRLNLFLGHLVESAVRVYIYVVCSGGLCRGCGVGDSICSVNVSRGSNVPGSAVPYCTVYNKGAGKHTLMMQVIFNICTKGKSFRGMYVVGISAYGQIYLDHTCLVVLNYCNSCYLAAVHSFSNVKGVLVNVVVYGTSVCVDGSGAGNSDGLAVLHTYVEYKLSLFSEVESLLEERE